MTSGIALALAVAAFGSILLVCFGLYSLRQSGTVQQRLRKVSVAVGDLSAEDELLEPTAEYPEWLVALGRRLAPSLPRFERDRLLSLRVRAADARPLEVLVASKVLWAIGLALCLGGFTFVLGTAEVAVLIAFVAALLGYVIPNLQLAGAARRRAGEVLGLLADSVDLLVVSMEAGLSLDASMAKLHERWPNALTYEFSRVLTQQRLGRSRREALTALAERMGVPDVQTFADTITQAEELGVPFGDVLSSLAQELRTRRRQRAEEQARAAPVKMMLPTVLLIFPVTFIVVLGPAIPGIVKAFTGQ